MGVYINLNISYAVTKEEWDMLCKIVNQEKRAENFSA